MARVFAGQDPARIPVLFKKIDSLWRGNVGAEVASLTDLGYHVLIAGALPQLRRTVVDGRPYADGVPLADTGLWKAEATAPPSRRVADVPGAKFSSGGWISPPCAPRALADKLRELFSGDEAVTVVADGETEADLEAVVDALAQLDYAAGGRRIVLVGTGGIATVLAQTVRHKRHSGADTQITVPARNAQIAAGRLRAPQTSTDSRAARPVLAVVGSASEAARRQLRELQAGGFALVGLSPEELREPGTSPKLQLVREALAAGEPVALTVVAETGGSPRSRHDRQQPGALRFERPGPANPQGADPPSSSCPISS